MDETIEAQLGDVVQTVIERSLNEHFFNNGPHYLTEIGKLIGLGELIDRLTIVNMKLYNLKDEVMKRKGPESVPFRAWAAEEDIRLVMERSQAKRAIDEKIYTMMLEFITTGSIPRQNKETKKYGEAVSG